MTVPAPLLAHYATDSNTLAWAVRVERTDGTVYGWTSAGVDVPASADLGDLGELLYASAPGLDVASFATSAGFAVDNSELTILPDDMIITRADILAGRWNNAAWTLMRYNWADPSMGAEVRGGGKLGEVRARSGSFVAELRGPQQPLQQPVLSSGSTKTCRYRLGSTAMPEGLCMVDIASATYTKTGTLTHVTSKQVIRDSTRAEAADFFGEGVLTFTDGLNANLSQKVKIHAADGTFTLSLPMIFTPEVGNAYSVHAGCRKRLDEDCETKFDNTLNFGGEPHRPTVDELTSSPEASA